MTNEMSGEIECFAQERQKNEEERDRKEGLPLFNECKFSNEAIKILEAPTEYFSKLSPSQCWEAGLTITRFAFYIQTLQNKEQAKVRWADESIRKMVGSKMGSQKAYNHDERRSMAIAVSPKALELEKIRVDAQLRVDRLMFLSARASDIAKVLQNRRKDYE